MKLICALIITSLMAAGCSSSASTSLLTTHCRAACQSSLLGLPSTGSRPPAATDSGLTGFGATRAAWDAHHAADPDSSLAKVCCYGPPVGAPDNGGTASTWNLAASGADVIDNVTHNFAPHTSEAEALAHIVGDDLPSDAAQADSGTQNNCKTIVYASAQLAVADPGLGKSISVTLYSPIDTATGNQEPYDVDNVTMALETPGTSTLDPC